MTDLDTFRQALKEQDMPGLDPEAPRLRTLDIGVIMVKGRRLRRRRQLAAAGGVLCLAAAVFGAAAGISQLTRPSPAVRPATSGGSSTHVVVGQDSPAPAPVPSPVREGRLVRSGISVGGGELVFYGVRVDARQLPKVSFGIMAGRQASSGGVTSLVETNETNGSATTPGFHAIEAAMNVGTPAVNVPEFGYYAGPAAAITARQGGRLVHASLARWSANPDIVIFWFPSTTSHSKSLTALTATTATGHHLPAGHTATGVG